MQLMPKRVKYRKSQRGTMKGNATRGNKVAFGDFGLMSLEHVWLDARTIEAGRVAASHHIGQDGKLWVRVFPHKSITAKAAETGMGMGKGEPSYYACVVKPGKILYEIGGLSEELAKEALNYVAHKMPVRTKMVKREHTI